MGHCEETESALLPPVRQQCYQVCSEHGCLLLHGGCVLSCVLCRGTALSCFVASQKVQSFEAFMTALSPTSSTCCDPAGGCAAPGHPAPARGAARGCSPDPQSPVLRCWVPAVCRAVAAGGAVCPSACCQRAAGAPLQPPTSQGVADPLQASSFEAVLASRAPQRYEMSPFQVFQGAVPSPSSFREHYVRHSYELQLLPRLLCSA